jgi:glycine hydroxymethyltransferase
MASLGQTDPDLAELLADERRRLEETIDLIAAENTPPPEILEMMGSVFNIKTIEGYPGKRFHAGCRNVDAVERLAVDRCRQLFQAGHANVQPHSGTSANLAVYFSVLEPGDPILAMSLPHGGHLSHGHRASMTSRCFRFEHYRVDSQTELIDYEEMRRLARSFRPRMIVAGASSYPRLIDYEQVAAIAREVSAYLLVDMAHIAGLVAAEVIPSPVPVSDFVTFTCYKTMLGPRGGVVLGREDLAKRIDSAVFPGGQGTSPVNTMAAKALCFQRALNDPEFSTIQRETVRNAQHLASCLSDRGYRLVTGGTDNHQVIPDVGQAGISGKAAEELLEAVGIVCNRNVIPSDAEAGSGTSGIRLGTQAATVRGMGFPEMERLADLIDRTLKAGSDAEQLDEVRTGVRDLAGAFPVYEGS